MGDGKGGRGSGAAGRLRKAMRAPTLLAVPAGLAMALGQAPWGLWPVALAGMAATLGLIATAADARQAFLRGWLAGAAGFMLALSWIVDPFMVDLPRHGWMAPFALLLLPGGLALFWGLAAAFTVWAARSLAARLALAVPALMAGEALRGFLFTGFPWAQAGHVWIDTPVLQLAALGGAFALSALALGLGAALAFAVLAPMAPMAARAPGQRRRAAATLALAALVLGGAWGWGAGWLPGVHAGNDIQARADTGVGTGTGTGDAAPPLRLRLVQPNATQALKWDPRYVDVFFRRHLDLSATPPEDGRAPDLVIWSETSVPFFLERPGAGLEMAAEAAGGAQLLMGIQRSEPAPGGTDWRYFNALAVIGPDGAPEAVYDKHHLVPFGEYMPVLGRYADRLGQGWAGGIASQVLMGYTAGPGPAVLDLGEAGRVLPLICYEAIFARNLRSEERPDWIVQVTNDAWFGNRTGPYQHLAQARLRAVEQGLPLVRVANTGVSAVIDGRGRVVASLGMNRAGIVDADLPPALPATVYAATGDAPWHLALGLVLLLVALGRWRNRH